MQGDEIARAREKWEEADQKASDLERELFATGDGYGDPDAERAARHRVDCARALAERRYREYNDLRALNVAPRVDDATGRERTGESSAITVRRCLCNECRRDTSHVVHHEKSYHSHEEIDSGFVVRESTTHLLCSCAGCDSVVMITETIGDTTNGEVVVVYHPARTVRPRPKWLSRFSWTAHLRADPKYPFFQEVYDALDMGALRIAMLGVRSLAEHVMLEQIEDQGSFGRNLSAFHSAGHVSQQQRSALEMVIDLGNAVTHRAHAPTQDQVFAALDVVESIVQSVYVDHENIRAAIDVKRPRERGSSPKGPA